ncbi:hypothetical protein [Idiomarina abyssalis]|uniref:hypothetical protein n=1 Tax=Idiomarina abyssalis TaxID=86102 RepID=UPI003A91C26E
MKKMTFILTLLIISGCAKNSGVVPYGNGKYMVSRQAATGFHGMEGLKSEALKEASAQCQKKDKAVKIIKEIDAEPPYIMGNFPRTEIHFTCISSKP